MITILWPNRLMMPILMKYFTDIWIIKAASINPGASSLSMKRLVFLKYWLTFIKAFIM